MSAHESVEKRAVNEVDRLLENISYRLKYLAIYGIFIAAYLPAGISKVFQSVPEAIEKEFDTTWVATFPGTVFSWKLAGVFEILASVLFIVSLIALEWQPGRRKPWMRIALATSACTFMVLAAGQDFAEKFSGAFELFAYLAGTFVVWLVVRKDEEVGIPS